MTILPPSRRLDPLRDMRQLVLFAKIPLVALAPGTRSIETHLWDNGVRYYFVTAADGTGPMATQADADVLVWVASMLTAAKNAGEQLSSVVPYRPASILRFLGRPLGGRQSALLEGAVYRLHATTICSNYDAGGCIRPAFDTLISRIDYAKGTRRISSISVGPWFIDQIERNRILKIDPASLKLRGLERRIYGWARVYANRSINEPWTIPTEVAWFKAIGDRHTRASGSFRKFRHAVRRLVARNQLPGFDLCLVGDPRNPTLQIRSTAGYKEGHLESDVSSVASITLPMEAVPPAVDPTPAFLVIPSP